MGIIAVGVLAVLVLVVATVVSRRQSTSSRATPAPRRPRFGAVELIAGANSCAAAKKLAGERLLAADAAILPLDGCSAQCRCSYQRYSDRREINRRREDDGLPEHFIYVGAESRSQDSRRS